MVVSSPIVSRGLLNLQLLHAEEYPSHRPSRNCQPNSNQSIDVEGFPFRTHATDGSRNTLIEAPTPVPISLPAPTSSQLKSRTSIIWQHGSEQTINNVLYWVCSQCSHRLRFSGSTTNAKNHLRTHRIVETASPPSDLSRAPDRATQDLCIFLAASHLPLVKVQHPRFKSFCTNLGYTPPCRTTIRNTHLPRIADQIRSTIASVRLPLFLTTDLWTGRSREKFLGVTAHYTTLN